MSTSEKSFATPYDEVLYLSSAFPTSRPDNLSVIARLAGIVSPAVENSRVLEIGCAAGRNLAPMAQALPNSRFLGIDLSARQIERAIDIAQRAKLANIEYRCQDILDFNDPSPFDYIIVHGIYSWVPRGVRNKIMEICQKCLSDTGLAYISYNTYPGWHLKKITRDLMRYHARNLTASSERVAGAKEILNMVTAAQTENTSVYAKVIRELAPKLTSAKDWNLAHDDLEEDCDPVYFHEFVAHAEAYQLRYLGGAEPSMNLAAKVAPYWRDRLRNSCRTVLDLEQYADFINGTQYRASVLCKASTLFSAPNGIQAVPELYLAAMVIEGPDPKSPVAYGEVRFYNPLTKGDATTSDPILIAALRQLGNIWPHATSFHDLLMNVKNHAPKVTVDALARGLLSTYITDLTEFWTRPTTFLSSAPKFPQTTLLARIQAEMGDPVIGLRHHEFAPVTSFVKEMISLMDGTRDLQTIRSALTHSLMCGNFNLPDIQGLGSADDPLDVALRQAMALLTVNSLLVNNSSQSYS